MKKYIFLIITIMYAVCNTMAYDVTFEGTSKTPVKIPADRNTGLDDIYVLYDMREISALKITGFSGTIFDISEYSNLGGGYAQELNFDYDSGVMSVNSPAGDRGYLVKDGDKSYNFWVVNYADHQFAISQVAVSESQDCDVTELTINADAAPIHYYTINGQQKVLSRDISMTWQNLEWNEASLNYTVVERNRVLEYISGNVAVTPPLYTTSEFHISGDRFLTAWDMMRSATSSPIKPNGIAVQTQAEQASYVGDGEDYVSNQIKGDASGLGGSAPAEIMFSAYITDGVMHSEWQMASDPEFQYLTYRFNEQDLTYTFTEEGQYYLRFIGSNADGSCESIGDTYTVSIGASDLRIPNAFSPDGDGTNDIWKVGYRSLLDFRCWIFDKNGNQLCYFDNPEHGWDGKYKGKYVSPGVYYYVIEAKGADGKKYKKGGDINILRYKSLGSAPGSSSGSE